MLTCTPSRSFVVTPAPPFLYPLSLHDALPISPNGSVLLDTWHFARGGGDFAALDDAALALVGGVQLSDRTPDQDALPYVRSEEHTSELQSRRDLVCRLLLENTTMARHCMSSLA